MAVEYASVLQDSEVMQHLQMLDAVLVDPPPSRKRLAMISAHFAHLDLESWRAMAAHQLILHCVFVSFLLR